MSACNDIKLAAAIERTQKTNELLGNKTEKAFRKLSKRLFLALIFQGLDTPVMKLALLKKV